MGELSVTELTEEIEAGLQKQLDKTERWAKENFDGEEKILQDFIMGMRSQTLDAIILITNIFRQRERDKPRVSSLN